MDEGRWAHEEAPLFLWFIFFLSFTIARGLVHGVTKYQMALIMGRASCFVGSHSKRVVVGHVAQALLWHGARTCWVLTRRQHSKAGEGRGEGRSGAVAVILQGESIDLGAETHVACALDVDWVMVVIPN